MGTMKSLEELRKEIDDLDHELLQILAKRMSTVKEVGDIKNVQGLPIIDDKRRQALLDIVGKKAESLHLSKQFVEKLFNAIHDHAVEVQKRK